MSSQSTSSNTTSRNIPLDIKTLMGNNLMETDKNFVSNKSMGSVALKKIAMCLSAISLLLLQLLLLTACGNKEDSYDGNLYRILAGDKYGFIDKYGKVRIEPQYDEAHRYFYEDICYVRMDGKGYLIDRRGNIKSEIPDSVQNVYKFIDGFARISGASGEGILSAKGVIVVPTLYPKTSVNKDGDNVYFLIEGVDGRNNRDWFLADTLGAQIGQKYDSILGGFSNGLAPVKLDGKWGYIDTTGNLAIESTYDAAHQFSQQGIARVRKGRNEYFIDKAGNNIIGDDIDIDKALTDFMADRAAVVVNVEKFLIDIEGNKVCSLDYDEIHEYDTYSLATAIHKGKANKIDISGEVVLETKLNNIGQFHDGVAFAQDNNKYGVIDLHGNVIVEPRHEQFHPTDNRELLIFSDKKNGRNCYSYYDYQGNLIWQDIPQKIVSRPRNKPRREDFVEYFDANIASLDPIEGIYYITNKGYHQDAIDPENVELAYTRADFMAVVRNDAKAKESKAKDPKDKDSESKASKEKEPKGQEYIVYLIDGTGRLWANKFVREGDSNTYAIINNSKSKDHKYSLDSEVTITDPDLFEFRLDQVQKDPRLKRYVTYEFVRDYPALSEYQQYKRTNWVGTGFAIADGIVATTYRVTNGAKTITVKGVNGNMGKAYRAYVIASDKALDLSLIKIVDKEFEGFGTIPYSIENKTSKSGDEILVWEFPSHSSSSWSNDLKLWEGTISSTSAYIGNESMYLVSLPEDAPVNNGSPVLNSVGNIIGIMCEKHTDAIQNEDFAIKAAYLLDLFNLTNYKLNLSDKPFEDKEPEKTSDKIKQAKDFVYLIECTAK